jgi:cell wall-associated NlpC family hydrolase
MYNKRLTLCVALLLSCFIGSINAQTTRPRRVADSKTPATASPKNEPETTPATPRKRRPEPQRQPPVLKERARDKALWADIDPGAPAPTRSYLPGATIRAATTPAPLVKKTAIVTPAAPPPRAFASRLQNAIDERLGIPYVFGASGNGGYDCSGFVWSVFQEAGASFPREAARHYWARFEAPPPGQEYRYGNLVFFNKLGHVGIIGAGGTGFYHASASKGVMFSPFDKYWTPRIDGFRRVSLN